VLTKLTIRHFKRFDEAVIDLAEPVVLIGPNNSGKTTVLQALALWDLGLRTWLDKRGKQDGGPEKRPGVSINRKDLFSLSVPNAIVLWNDLHVRATSGGNGERGTKNILIEIEVDGVAAGQEWSCGLEFDYANEESFYCRPLRLEQAKNPRRMSIPDGCTDHRVAFLPPMSGLSDREFVKQEGEIGFLIGQGQTAQVLRNMCHSLFIGKEGGARWDKIVACIQSLFGVELMPPRLVSARSEIQMSYREAGGPELDLSCSGRGLQQTLLLMAFLHANPKSILLLDEPDAHLEILRQRQIFNLLTETASNQGSQIVAASHSEVVLGEAAARGKVVAFVGRPHVINDRGQQALKALRDIGFDQYYQAEHKGWVLYLEDTTDLDILRAFAEKLRHPVLPHLDTCFLHPVATNLPQRARDHFFGLREAKPDLVGVAVFDRLDRELTTGTALIEMMWQKREIENYIYSKASLLRFSASGVDDDLLGLAERRRREAVMEESIREMSDAWEKLGRPSPWSDDIKATDDFLEPLFRAFSQKLRLPLLLRKNEYSKLVLFTDPDESSAEIVEKLDAILEVAKRAHPFQ
jgi:hypothetical protein